MKWEIWFLIIFGAHFVCMFNKEYRCSWSSSIVWFVTSKLLLSNNNDFHSSHHSNCMPWSFESYSFNSCLRTESEKACDIFIISINCGAFGYLSVIRLFNLFHSFYYAFNTSQNSIQWFQISTNIVYSCSVSNQLVHWTHPFAYCFDISVWQELNTSCHTLAHVYNRK